MAEENKNHALQKLLFTVDEIADVLRISPKSVYNGLSTKTFPIPGLKIGRQWRFRRDDVLSFINQ